MYTYHVRLARTPRHDSTSLALRTHPARHAFKFDGELSLITEANVRTRSERKFGSATRTPLAGGKATAVVGGAHRTDGRATPPPWLHTDSREHFVLSSHLEASSHTREHAPSASSGRSVGSPRTRWRSTASARTRCPFVFGCTPSFMCRGLAPARRRVRGSSTRLRGSHSQTLRGTAV